MSPLYLFELLYLVTFQLKLWYFVGALADDLIRLTNNNKALGKSIFTGEDLDEQQKSCLMEYNPFHLWSSKQKLFHASLRNLAFFIVSL